MITIKSATDKKLVLTNGDVCEAVKEPSRHSCELCHVYQTGLCDLPWKSKTPDTNCSPANGRTNKDLIIWKKIGEEK